MRAKFRILHLLALFLLVAGAGVLNAQNTLDTGSLRGRITDSRGNPLPGALVRAKGSQGAKGAESDAKGNYNIPFLTPGVYEVTVTMDGYSTQIQSGVAIIAQQSSGQTFKLSEGTDTITVKAGAGVDTHATTVTTKINLTTAIKDFALGNNFTEAFDFAPGAVANSGVGSGNYSISGASGLENQYFIGGVNITNSGYGAIGAYEVTGAANGTGITSAFLENLDIREGGFDAEYGGALGGVISATVKSGGNDYHGGVNLFYSPRRFNASTQKFTRSGGFFNRHGSDNTDIAVEFSGPIIKDKLFFFVGYNPVWRRDYHSYDIAEADLARDGIVAPFANREYDQGNNRTDNIALRLTWAISEKHRLDGIYFSSPSARSGAIRHLGRRVNPAEDYGIPTVLVTNPGFPITEAGDGVQGSVKVRDHNGSLKYFGTITPWLNIEALISYHRNQVVVRPAEQANTMRVEDYRRLDVFNQQQATQGQTGVPTPPIVSPAIYTFGGLGGYQAGSNDENLNLVLKVTNNFNWLGAHELKWGVDYIKLKFREKIEYTGIKPTVFLATTPNEDPFNTFDGHPDSFIQMRTGVSAAIRCFLDNDPTQTDLNDACSRSAYRQHYRVYRGSFNPPTPDTYNKELNLFLQETWSFKNVTLKAGLRYTREEIGNPSNYSLRSTNGNPLISGVDRNPVGSTNQDCIDAFYATVPPPPPGSQIPLNCYIAGPGQFVGTSYRFKGEFSPRIGVSWDVLGNGKSKLYMNYARLFERVPNDLAVRSFGNEFGVTNIRFANPDMTGQTRSQSRIAFTTGAQATRIQPGTRLPYKDDVVAGYEFEIAPQFKVDIKANFRKQGRVLEDIQASPIEAILNQNYYTQYSNQRLFPEFGFASFGEYIMANVDNNTTASYTDCPTYNSNLAFCSKVPVTFGRPSHKYKALSITLQKQPQEGGHLSLFATYRISKVLGNYEGLYRNDNGQSDPNITSLYDFPLTHLTRSQYSYGVLNTDTPHALKINMGYRDLLFKNLTGSVSFKWQSGQPRTPLIAHPVYQNSGEIPGQDPVYFSFQDPFNTSLYTSFVIKDYTAVNRGSLGRLASTAIWDTKFSYKLALSRSSFNFSLMISNLFNAQEITKYEDDVELQTAVRNPFFGMPSEAQEPRTLRLGLGWSF